MPNSGMNAATAQRNDWRTPRRLFDALNAEFNFTIDAAADSSNAKLPRYWDEAANGLKRAWDAERVFCNPPFSTKGAWAEKAALSDAEVAVLILPVVAEQKWVHDWVIGIAAEVRFIRGRVAFDPPPGVVASAPRFGTMIVVYRRNHSGQTTLLSVCLDKYNKACYIPCAGER